MYYSATYTHTRKEVSFSRIHSDFDQMVTRRPNKRKSQDGHVTLTEMCKHWKPFEQDTQVINYDEHMRMYSTTEIEHKVSIKESERKQKEEYLLKLIEEKPYLYEVFNEIYNELFK